MSSKFRDTKPFDKIRLHNSGCATNLTCVASMMVLKRLAQIAKKLRFEKSMCLSRSRTRETHIDFSKRTFSEFLQLERSRSLGYKRRSTRAFF